MDIEKEIEKEMEAEMQTETQRYRRDTMMDQDPTPTRESPRLVRYSQPSLQLHPCAPNQG